MSRTGSNCYTCGRDASEDGKECRSPTVGGRGYSPSTNGLGAATIKKTDDGATPKTKPWPVAFSPPASPTSVHGGNRTRSPSPCVDLNALSSDDSEVDVTPQFRRFVYPGGVYCVLFGGRSSAEHRSR